jgi:hypothetical protein
MTFIHFTRALIGLGTRFTIVIRDRDTKFSKATWTPRTNYRQARRDLQPEIARVDVIGDNRMRVMSKSLANHRIGPKIKPHTMWLFKNRENIEMTCRVTVDAMTSYSRY